MPEYALLVRPSSNRVYGETAVQLTVNELKVFGDRALGGGVCDIAENRIGGVPYITFTADGLDDRHVGLLSNLSSLYALFERRGDLMHPITVAPLDRFDSDLLSIQKYSGKTNEQFTKLLLNVTILGTDTGFDGGGRTLRVMDPMCGRGTTLNQALMYGFDAAGMDVDGKDFDAYATFLRTWLKNKRLKHQADVTTIRRDRANVGRRFHAVVGASKEEYRDGKVIDISVIHADTRRCLEFFRPKTFDALVMDAPYGIQHASRSGDPRASRSGDRKLQRTPLELLAEAIPSWVELLRPGGAIGISWNTLVGRRDAIADLLVAGGLDVLDTDGYTGFRHRVDQAIKRDLIVARRPSPAGQ